MKHIIAALAVFSMGFGAFANEHGKAMDCSKETDATKKEKCMNDMKMKKGTKGDHAKAGHEEGEKKDEHAH